jgi:hypothetical protein
MCYSFSYVTTFFKDIAPALVGLAALFFANRNIVKQARIDRKHKWVELFRNEFIAFTHATYDFQTSLWEDDKTRMQGSMPILYKMGAIQVLLDIDVPLQDAFHTKLVEYSAHIQRLSKAGLSTDQIKEINDSNELLYGEIQVLAQRIIKSESF